MTYYYHPSQKTSLKDTDWDAFESYYDHLTDPKPMGKRKYNIGSYFQQSKLRNTGQKTYSTRKAPYRAKYSRVLKNVFLPQSTYRMGPRKIAGWTGGKHGTMRFTNYSKARKAYVKKRRYYKRKRTYKRRGTGLYSRLSKQLGALAKKEYIPWQQDATLGSGVTDQTLVNVCKYDWFGIGSRADFLIALSKKQVVEPNYTDGTLEKQTWNMSTFEGVKVEIRISYHRTYINNYNIPVTIWYWPGHTLLDNSTSVASFMDQGFTSAGITAHDSPAHWPGTSLILKKYHKLGKMGYVKLGIGQKHTFRIGTFVKTVDSSNYIDNTNQYWKGFKFIYLRMLGEIGHDAAETGAGYMKWKLDHVDHKIIKYRFKTGQRQMEYNTLNQLVTPVELNLPIVPGAETQPDP